LDTAEPLVAEIKPERRRFQEDSEYSGLIFCFLSEALGADFAEVPRRRGIMD
jgi:hypothetical protein